MSYIVILFCLIYMTVNSTMASAQNLTSIQIFERCYIRMTRTVPNKSDALYQSVVRKKTAAADACLALFQRAQFNSGGVLKNRSDFLAKRILKTFNDLHQSWFSIRVNAIDVNGAGTVTDLDEPGLYFTKAVFSPSMEFRSVLTSETGLEGVRDPEVPITSDFKASRLVTVIPSTRSYAAASNFTLAYFKSTIVPLTDAQKAAGMTGPTYQYNRELASVELPKAVQVGELVGVQSMTPVYLKAFLGVISQAKFNTFSPALKAALHEARMQVNLNEHFGGGVLGSQGFFRNNANLTRGKFADGYESINRRISSKIYEDLLCHEMPTLTLADIQSEVNPKSPYTFQQGATCLQCHSSMDNMAFAYRNLYINMTATNAELNAGLSLSPVSKIPIVPDDAFFAAQQPAGKLHYRELIEPKSYTRKLVNLNFSSIQEMGQELADQNDFYRCAAKRYYQFFTGINVSLSQKASTKLELYNQKYVLDLADKLKSTQSVESILHDIFASKAFQSRSYLPTEAK